MTTAKLPGNVTVEIIEPEHIQSFWLKGRYYESDMLEYIRAHYHGGTFIDCGACIGNHALFFARFCAQQVIAVEPVQRNLDHMRSNIHLSGLDSKIDIVAAAVGFEPGRGSMLLAGNNHGNYQLVSGTEVEVTTIDTIAALAQHSIGLIKLDIEGGELQALQGATKTLKRFKPGLFVELAQKSALDMADHFLTQFGYKRIARFNSTPTYYYGAF